MAFAQAMALGVDAWDGHMQVASFRCVCGPQTNWGLAASETVKTNVPPTFRKRSESVCDIKMEVNAPSATGRKKIRAEARVKIPKVKVSAHCYPC